MKSELADKGPTLLYVDSNFASPYALVAFVSLLEKGLTFEVKPLELFANAHREAGFASTSITSRVPTLVHEGFALSESSAICEYIDETFTGTRIYPTDLCDRARARQVQAWVRSDLMPIREERPTFVVFGGVKRPASFDSSCPYETPARLSGPQRRSVLWLNSSISPSPRRD